MLNNANPSLCFHSDGSPPLSAALIHRCVLSILPLLDGVYAQVMLCVMPNVCITSLKAEDKNCPPRSVVIVIGILLWLEVCTHNVWRRALVHMPRLSQHGRRTHLHHDHDNHDTTDWDSKRFGKEGRNLFI